VPPEILEGGAEAVREASARWRIPARILEADPAGHEAWAQEAAAATAEVLRG
jgi:hypothetical protein